MTDKPQPIVQVDIENYDSECGPRCDIVVCGLRHITTPGQLAEFIQLIYAAVDTFDDQQREALKQRKAHHVAKSRTNMD